MTIKKSTKIMKRSTAHPPSYEKQYVEEREIVEPRSRKERRALAAVRRKAKSEQEPRS